MGLTVTGSIDSCAFASITVLYNGERIASTYRQFGGAWTPALLVGGGFITAVPTHLTLNASCGAMGDNPVPAFDAQVTVAQTARDTTPTSTLN